MRTSALVGAKNLGFSKIYGVSARTGGRGSEDIFRTRGERESIFFDFVQTSFMYGPLSKDSRIFLKKAAER